MITKIETSDNQVDLFDWYKIINSRIKTIFSIILVCVISALLYCILAQPYYRSYITIYPSAQEKSISNSLGNFEGMISSMGFEPPLNSQKTNIYIPDIIESRKLKRSILENKWELKKTSNSIELISYWGLNEKSNLNHLNLYQYISSNVETPELMERIYFEDAMEKLTDQLSVLEKESGLIYVEVLMEDPELAANIANYIGKYVKDYLSYEISTQSTKNRIFVNEQMNNAKHELFESEVALMEFQRINPMVQDNPENLLNRDRLIRNLEVNQQVYITLRQQYELVKIDEMNEIPVINILDVGEVSVRPVYPRKLMIIISAFILGCILSCLIVYISLIRNRLKEIPR